MVPGGAKQICCKQKVSKGCRQRVDCHRVLQVLSARGLFDPWEEADMKKLIFLVFALLLAGGTRIAAQDVRYNFDSKANFSKYKTYKWVDIKGADRQNQLVEEQIKDTVHSELQRGLTKTDADNGDLSVGYQTAMATEKQSSSYNTGWGYGPGRGGGWYGAWVQR